MFWYRQRPGQGLMLMATANQGSEATYESGFAKDKFPISRPNLTFSVLTVSNVSLEDSSLYFCSSDAQRWAPIRDLSKNRSCLLPSSHPDEPWTLPRLAGGGNHCCKAHSCSCACQGRGSERPARDGERIVGITRRLQPQTGRVAIARLRMKFLPEDCLQILSKDNQIQFVFKWQGQKYP